MKCTADPQKVNKNRKYFGRYLLKLCVLKKLTLKQNVAQQSALMRNSLLRILHDKKKHK